jgi:hypothetical protein
MTDITSFWPGYWFSISIMVGLISLFVAVLIHMIGNSFGIKELVLFAKAEYAQIAVTFLIIGGVYAFINLGIKISEMITAEIITQAAPTNLASLPLGNQASPFGIAKKYIEQVLLRCADKIYNAVFWVYFWYSYFTSLSFSVANVEGIGPGFYTGPYASLAFYFTQNLFYLGLFSHVMRFFLIFSEYTMIQIFLPIGIILRSFPLTRGVGGLLIGFAIGFGIVFPLTYIIIIAMTQDSSSTLCGVLDINMDDVRSKQMFGAKFLENDPCFNNIGTVYSKRYIQQSSTESESDLQRIFTALKYLYISTVLYPLVSLIITFTFIRQTGSLFGADLAEIGRGLIKII